MSPTRAGLLGAGLAYLMALPVPPSPADAQELVDQSTLRVCADPNNLPYSNEAGDGFENELARMLAADLDVSLEYTWYPGTIGFVRNTLGANLCDVVVGVVHGSELMQNTNPYYRSSYVMISRAEDEALPTGLDDPAITELKIGIMARTPPVNLLAKRGLLGNIKTYDLMVDTRHYAPARDMIEDLAGGEIDIALVWGPLGGYWAEQNEMPMRVVPLEADEGSRIDLDYRISMGLRRNEPDWKLRLNAFLDEHEDEIQALLMDYGVPLLDRQGQLIAP